MRGQRNDGHRQHHQHTDRGVRGQGMQRNDGRDQQQQHGTAQGRDRDEHYQGYDAHEAGGDGWQGRALDGRDSGTNGPAGYGRGDHGRGDHGRGDHGRGDPQRWSASQQQGWQGSGPQRPEWRDQQQVWQRTDDSRSAGSGYGDPGGYGRSMRGDDGPTRGRFGDQEDYAHPNVARGSFEGPRYDQQLGSQGWRGSGNYGTPSAPSPQGRGPKGYQRSDERIREDICEALDDGAADAREVEVSVSGGHVTLTGTVPSRRDKRSIEDVADGIRGVHDISNNVRIDRGETRGRDAGATQPSAPTPSARSDNGKRPS